MATSTTFDDDYFLWDIVQIGFQGMRWDVDLELYSGRGRFYDPLAGRFTSPSSGGWLAGATDLYTFDSRQLGPRGMGRFGRAGSSTTLSENFSSSIDPTFAAVAHVGWM